MAEPTTSDSFRAARESDFRRMVKQLAAVDHAQRALAARVAALENAAANLRADVRSGFDVDRELSEAIEAMIADVAACQQQR